MKRRGRPVKAALAELRPTQMALGYGEVAHKRREWKALPPSAARRQL